MPVSKKRKKNGKVVKSSEVKRAERLKAAIGDDGDQAPLTLQDLINVVAYQEAVKDGRIVPPPTVKIDFDDEDTQAVIRAVDEASKYKIEEEQ